MFLHLNVSGKRFQILKSTCRQYPNSKFEKLVSVDGLTAYRSGICHAFTQEGCHVEFYFERPLYLFELVLALVQTGKLHRPLNCCESSLDEELAFWEVTPRSKCRCCLPASSPSPPQSRCSSADIAQSGCVCSSTIDGVPTPGAPINVAEQQLLGKPVVTTSAASEKNALGAGTIESSNKLKNIYFRCKRYTWLLLEKPTTSSVAMIFCVISLLFICMTVVSMILESLPEFQHRYCMSSDEIGDSSENVTLVNPSEDGSNCKLVRRPVFALVVIDLICIIWFTMEYLLRLWSAPNRWKYFKNALSIVDLIAILPFYLELLISQRGPFDSTKSRVGLVHSAQSSRSLRVFRVFRSLRILKIARYSSDIRLLALALRRSLSELLMILVYVLFATFFYATILYNLEIDFAESRYKSIPAAAWWTMATLFTYSDAPPVSVGGKVVSASGFVAGVLLLAFPITVLVDKFGQMYQERREKQPKKAGTPTPLSNHPPQFPCNSTKNRLQKHTATLTSAETRFRFA